MGESSRSPDRPDVSASDDQRRGISRRTLIRRAAATGAVAWTAPVIIESLTSPAAAVTGGFPCSYATIVVSRPDPNNANKTLFFAVKVVHNAMSCTLTNATSGDGTFPTVDCPSGTYTRGSGSGNPILRNGTAVPADSSCPVTVSGGVITATGNNTIVFAIAHDGGCGSSHFCGQTCSGPFTAPQQCTGADA